MKIRLLIFTAFSAATSCATTINLGVFSFAASSVTNQFTLDNYSSAASGVGCTVDFPSCTPVRFSNLDLLVTRADGSQLEFNGLGPLSDTDPTLVLEEFDSADSFLSARLTGQFSQTALTLFDLSGVTVDPAFDIALNPDPSSGRTLLSPGDDLAVIMATEVATSTPEPRTLVSILFGAALLSKGFRRHRSEFLRYLHRTLRTNNGQE